MEKPAEKIPEPLGVGEWWPRHRPSCEECSESLPGLGFVQIVEHGVSKEAQCGGRDLGFKFVSLLFAKIKKLFAFFVANLGRPASYVLFDDGGGLQGAVRGQKGDPFGLCWLFGTCGGVLLRLTISFGEDEGHGLITTRDTHSDPV